MEVKGGLTTIYLSDELIKQAHSQSLEAHLQHNKRPYTTSTSKRASSSSSDVEIFAFPGSWEIKDWFLDHLFGETDVDSELFPSLRKIGEDKLAKVNRSFLERFQKLLQDTEFKTEIQKAVTEKKKIILTGHSSGGAVASFAALWILEKYARQQGMKVPIHCLTFGSPLVGNRVLSHAVRREKWAGHFTHFVMEHDIVPRMMLAPLTSIQEQLPNILKYFQQKVTSGRTTDQKTSKFFSKIVNRMRKKTGSEDQDHGGSTDNDQVTAFFENVLLSASAVASYAANDLMEPTGSDLMEKLSANFVSVSPYRPFGIYVFHTGNEDNLVVENPDAALQLLFYFCQLSDKDDHQNLAEFALNSLDENLSDGTKLEKNGFQIQSWVHLKDLNDHLLKPNRTLNKALYELSAAGRLCLVAAEEAEKRKKENEKEIDELIKKTEDQTKKSKRTRAEEKKMTRTETDKKYIEDLLKEILGYKEKHAEGGYYDPFKLQEHIEDFTANVNRLELAKIFDVIVEMLLREDLPDEFEGREEWVILGTKFTRLVEPLDVGNYYRHSKGTDTKMYSMVRPKRYKFTQRWYEHDQRTAPEQISDSNFLAEVEEIKKDFEDGKKEFDEVKEKMEFIEARVSEWKGKLGEDLFPAESMLLKWWRGLILDNQYR